MAIFYALTSKGLVEAVERELHELGLTKTNRRGGGVEFESNWQGCYLANLGLRSATRVVLPILDFPAYQPDDIYHNLRKHDFTKYIDVDGTLAVDAVVDESQLRDQRIVALKAKDAMVDQFRDRYGRRPDVEKTEPDLLVIVRVYKNNVSVSIDTSGTPLFKRGYRKKNVEAPLKEHLAAGLLELTGWRGDIPMVDLMCGSGTFLIEAALKALAIAPGTLRTGFAFQNYLGFQKEAWEQTLDQVMAPERDELPFKFYGFDVSRVALEAATANAHSAGVGDWIEFKKQAVDLVERPAEKGIIVVNPPYGQRLGHPEELKDVYRDLSHVLKKEFKGWDCWILSGDADLIAALKLKSTQKYFIMNGPIECRWLKYEMF